MTHLKILGCALVASVCLLALNGGAIAQADLFTDSAKTIKYPTGTTIAFTLNPGSSASYTSGGSTISTCTGSEIKGKTSNETGETVSISLESLTWEGCSQTTDTISKGQLQIKWTSGTSGTVSGLGSQWTYSIFGTSCTYGFGEGTHLGTITGGSSPTLKISTTITKAAGGFLCPSTAGLDAEYTLTSPHALYVGPAAQTSLFTDSAKTKSYPLGTVVDLSLASGSTSSFTSGGETIATCTGSTAKGTIASSAGGTNTVGLESLTWSGCSQTTHTTKAGKLDVKWTSGSNGEIIGRESTWTFGIFGTSCSYGVGEGIKLGTLVGGETPTLKVESLVPRTAGGVLCPAAVTWDAEYVVTEPHALYVGT
ncbi:MAG TPA: hypothetical protein VN733_04820 [Solirubrobacterales bacterium]|nr:hypothetical protein [Solirubrobacterales bacterium]